MVGTVKTALLGQAALVQVCAATMLPKHCEPGTKTILDDVGLLSVSIIGSIAGAWVFLTFCPEPPDEDAGSGTATRHMAMKFLASLFVGVFIAPLAIRYLEWTPDVDLVGGISFGIAVVAVGLVHKANELVRRYKQSSP